MSKRDIYFVREEREREREKRAEEERKGSFLKSDKEGE